MGETNLESNTRICKMFSACQLFAEMSLPGLNNIHSNISLSPTMGMEQMLPAISRPISFRNGNNADSGLSPPLSKCLWRRVLR